MEPHRQCRATHLVHRAVTKSPWAIDYSICVVSVLCLAALVEHRLVTDRQRERWTQDHRIIPCHHSVAR